MQNLFQKMKSKYRKRLLLQREEHLSVNTLIARLESKTFWSDITIGEFNSLCTWTDVSTFECSVFDIKYGDKFLKSKK